MKHQLHPGMLGVVSGWTQKAHYALDAMMSPAGPSETELHLVERFAQLVRQEATSVLADPHALSASDYSTVSTATRQVVRALSRTSNSVAIVRVIQAAESQAKLVHAARTQERMRFDQRSIEDARWLCSEFDRAIGEIDRRFTAQHRSQRSLAIG